MRLLPIERQTPGASARYRRREQRPYLPSALGEGWGAAGSHAGFILPGGDRGDAAQGRGPRARGDEGGRQGDMLCRPRRARHQHSARYRRCACRISVRVALRRRSDPPSGAPLQLRPPSMTKIATFARLGSVLGALAAPFDASATGGWVAAGEQSSVRFAFPQVTGLRLLGPFGRTSSPRVSTRCESRKSRDFRQVIGNRLRARRSIGLGPLICGPLESHRSGVRRARSRRRWRVALGMLIRRMNPRSPMRGRQRVMPSPKSICTPVRCKRKKPRSWRCMLSTRPVGGLSCKSGASRQLLGRAVNQLR